MQAVAEEVAKDLQTEIEPALRQQWMELAPLLGKLDGLVRDDIVALLKVDGLRTNGKPYTVAVSGGPLGEDFFRRDSTALAPSLLAALEFIENRSSAR